MHYPFTLLDSNYALAQSTYCCPLDVRFLQTMVTDEEVGQLENMIGRP